MVALKPLGGGGLAAQELASFSSLAQMGGQGVRIDRLALALEDLDQHRGRPVWLLLAQLNSTLEHRRLKGLRLTGIAAPFGPQRFKAVLLIGPQVAAQAGDRDPRALGMGDDVRLGGNAAQLGLHPPRVRWMMDEMSD